MPAFFVAVRNGIKDAGEMETYTAKAGASIVGHSVKALAVYGAHRATDGSASDGAVILEFPTFADAEAWYDSPEYQDAIQYRLRGGDYQTFIVDGV